MYLGIACFAALLATLWGWRTGFFRLALRLSAVLLAYAFTLQESPAFAEFLSRSGVLHGLVVLPVAYLILFLVGSAVCSLMTRSFVRLAPEEWQQGGRFSGALLGGVLGCGLGLLAVWMVGTMQATWQLQGRQDAQTGSVARKSGDTFFDHADSEARDLSGKVVVAVTKQALGNTAYANLAASMVREPLSIGKGLQHLSGKPELRLLFQNPTNYNVLLHGTGGDIEQLPEFQALVGDQQVMQFLSAVGLPGKGLSEQSASLAAMMSHYTNNFEKMRNTPDFQALAQDVVLHEKLQQGNFLGLLTDDKVRRLASMLAEDNNEPAARVNNQQQTEVVAVAMPDPMTKPAPDPVKALYKWHDDKGHVHITEQPPPEGITPDVITH